MNEILRGVTNRETGFASAAFPVNSTWQPGVESAEAAACRKLLHLQQGQPDWYTVGALSTLYSFPDYLDMIGERERTYELAAYVRPANVYMGGSLYPTPKGPPIVKRVPSEWPVQFRITLQYESDSTGLVSWGISSQSIRVRHLGDRTIPDWLPPVGISGEVLRNTPWASGYVFEILHEPAYYPHVVVAGRLSQHAPTLELLRRASLSGAFHGARSSAERLAIVLTALAIDQRPT